MLINGWWKQLPMLCPLDLKDNLLCKVLWGCYWLLDVISHRTPLLSAHTYLQNLTCRLWHGVYSVAKNAKKGRQLKERKTEWNSKHNKLQWPEIKHAKLCANSMPLVPWLQQNEEPQGCKAKIPTTKLLPCQNDQPTILSPVWMHIYMLGKHLYNTTPYLPKKQNVIHEGKVSVFDLLVWSSYLKPCPSNQQHSWTGSDYLRESTSCCNS